MLTVKELDFVKQCWLQLSTNLQIEQVVSQKLFHKIKSAYESTARHYHNFSHIYNLLQLSNTLFLVANDREKAVFNLAIFYHDIVYNANQKDNEAESAKIANQDFDFYLSNSEKHNLNAYILSTEKHVPIDNNIVGIALFLDIDLSVLAAPLSIYKKYAESVAAEYLIYYNQLMYNAGRLDFLKRTSEKATFYCTEQFATGENRAKENINWEINQLSNNI